MVTAAEFVDGPRGRGVLWALALARAAMVAGDPARAASWGLMTGADVDLTAALDGVRLDGVTAEEWHEALASTVAEAMYWQEPGESDRALADPSVRPALLVLAEQALAQGLPGGWDAPMEPAQFLAVFHGDEPAVVLADRLTIWREDALAGERRAARERPRDPRANWSGEWWSTPPHGMPVTRAAVDGVPTALRWMEDDFGWARAATFRARVPEDARVLEIRGPEDWVALVRAHPLEVTASRRHDWFRATGRDGRWAIPDWLGVADEYDAVHVSVVGYLRTATRALAVGDDVATVLAGWNPGETRWLVDLEYDPAPTRWRRDDSLTLSRDDGSPA